MAHPSSFGDLERPPLRERSLQRALAPDGWRLEVVEQTDSTNARVAERALAGEPAGLVVVAEFQEAGRGRLDRTWVSPPRAGLTFSVLLRPDLPRQQMSWLPLLTGLAVATALRDNAEVDAVLKWPNDVLVSGRKLCGVLAEMPVPGAAVVGVGLNVTTRASELPNEQATSLRLCGAGTSDRATVLRAVLRSLSRVLRDVGAAQAAYRQLCSTLGTQVRIDLPGGSSASGRAQAVDAAGHLVVDGVTHAAGDVVHLRTVTP